LDSGKARELLHWRPVWTFDEGVAATGEWYRGWLERSDVHSLKQMQNYNKVAKERGLPWAENVFS
jgi:CDP-glucose 4,6-dehydratase